MTEEIIAIVLEQIGIAGFSIAGISIVGLIGAAVYLVRAIRKIAKEVKGDNYIKELKKDYDEVRTELRETREELATAVKAGIEKDKKIDQLIDAVARCEGYHEQKD